MKPGSAVHRSFVEFQHIQHGSEEQEGAQRKLPRPVQPKEHTSHDVAADITRSLSTLDSCLYC